MLKSSESNELGLEVLGVGLPRSGTKSLQAALEMLYGEKCYHMLDIPNKRRADIPIWIRIFEQIRMSKTPDPGLMKKIFQNYRLIADQCAIPIELFNLAPQAKVILPVRDASKWAESVRETVQSDKVQAPKNCLDRLAQSIIFGRNYAQMIEMFIRTTIGYETDVQSDAQMIEAHAKYVALIQSTVPPEQLLLFNLSDGWEPLCRFLGKPIPQNQPFPHVNDRQQMLKFMRYGRIAVTVAKVIMIGLAIGLVALVVTLCVLLIK